VPFIVQRIAGQQSLIAYVASDVLRIGRGTNADLRFDDVAVALEHAVIEPMEGGYRLLDRGSVTGTYLNGKAVREAQLAANDLINIGGYQIRVQITDPEDPPFLSVRASAALHPPPERTARMSPEALAAALRAASAVAGPPAAWESPAEVGETTGSAPAPAPLQAAPASARPAPTPPQAAPASASPAATPPQAAPASARPEAPPSEAATPSVRQAATPPVAAVRPAPAATLSAGAATMRMSPEALAAALKAAAAAQELAVWEAAASKAAAGGEAAGETAAGEGAAQAPADELPAWEAAAAGPAAAPVTGIPQATAPAAAAAVDASAAAASAGPAGASAVERATQAPATSAAAAGPVPSSPPPPSSPLPSSASAPQSSLAPSSSPLPSPPSPPSPSASQSPPSKSPPAPSSSPPSAPPPSSSPPSPQSPSPPSPLPPSPPSSRPLSPAPPQLRAPVVDYLRAYSLRRPLFNKALLALVLTGAAAGVLLFLARSGRATAFEPGRVHVWHAETACASCHSPWRGPDPTLCSDCHAKQREKGEIHQAAQIFTPPCTGCHPEHRGGDRVAAVDDVQCASCHGELQVKPGAEPRFARNVRAFVDDHPDFSITLRSGVRLPLAEAVARRADPTTLRFNHLRHLRSGLPTPSGQRVQLSCEDCHHRAAGTSAANPSSPASAASAASAAAGAQAATPGGESTAAGGPTGIVPIAYETSCTTSGCHRLTFDNRRPGQVAPHASPRRVREFLVSVYSDRRGANESVRDQYRQLIRGAGAQPREIDYGGQAQGAVVLAERYLYGTACKECHVVDTNARPLPKVTWTPIPARWLPNGRFQHLDHPNDCRLCHGAAAASTVAADVLLPSITVCRTCHGGSGGAAQVKAGTAPAAPTNCLSCHRYHPDSPNPVQAALSLPAARPARMARAEAQP